MDYIHFQEHGFMFKGERYKILKAEDFQTQKEIQV